MAKDTELSIVGEPPPHQTRVPIGACGSFRPEISPCLPPGPLVASVGQRNPFVPNRSVKSKRTGYGKSGSDVYLAEWRHLTRVAIPCASRIALFQGYNTEQRSKDLIPPVVYAAERAPVRGLNMHCLPP